jgi:hypothetical protein
MATEFTEENFSILFDEQNKLVEVRYQGVNADALATLSTRVDGLETELDAALASSSGSIGTLSTSLGSLSTLVTALSGTVNADQLARIAGDEANAADTLNRHNIAMAAIAAETTNRAAALLAEAAARGAAITSATATIITDVAALATTVSGLAASVGGNTASIISVQDALATETSTRASQYASLLADYGNANAAILSESTVRASTDSALAAQIDALSATSGTNVFTQPNEPTTGMIAGDIWYDTDDGNKPYRYDGVNWVDVTDVRITQNAAAIVAEQVARANGDSANATSINTVSANLTTETNNRIAGDSTLQTNINTVAASVTTETNARVAADSANASSISTVSASLTTETNNRIAGDNALQGSINTVSASVTTETNARVSAINGVEAKYGIKVNANGHVAGFGLIATNNTYGNAGDSEFIMDATRVKIFNGSSAVAPFLVSGGTVYMQNVVVQNAQISSLDMGKVTAGNIQAALSATTAGSIRFGKTYYGSPTAGIYLGYSGGYVFDIGSSSTYMRWNGSGLDLYGATITLAGAGGYTRYLGVDVASTYIDWYGTGSITDANAKFFIKKDGSAMFGGRIRGEFEPKAWASIQGEGTPSVRDCYNVSSVAKYGTGKYRIYFYTALPNANYSCVAGGNDVSKIVILTVAAQTTTYVDVECNKRGDGNFIDISLLNIIIFGSNVPPASGGTNPSYNDDIYYGGTYGGGLIP